MAPRLELDTLLREILGSDNVYFQPPAGRLMDYPCIVYERNRIESEHAGNKPYSHYKSYTVTYIRRSPDDAVVDQIAALPTCEHNRFFASDNLNHDVFTLYF